MAFRGCMEDIRIECIIRRTRRSEEVSGMGIRNHKVEGRRGRIVSGTGASGG